MTVAVSYKTGLAWLRQGVLVRTDTANGDMFVDPTLGFTSFTLTDSDGRTLAPVKCEHLETGNNQGAPCLWAGYVLKFKMPNTDGTPQSLCYKGMRLMTVEDSVRLAGCACLR